MSDNVDKIDIDKKLFEIHSYRKCSAKMGLVSRQTNQPFMGFFAVKVEYYYLIEIIYSVYFMCDRFLYKFNLESSFLNNI